MQDLKVLALQSDLVWENPYANRIAFEEKIRKEFDNHDLIILPETFTTGFPVNPEKYAEEINGETMGWLKGLSSELNTCICGSFLLDTNSNYSNTLIWMRPDGSFERYDKRHVFSMGGEHKNIKAGESQLIVELKGWKIKPMICYDLRFPVWSKNHYSKTSGFEYDMAIYVANWPAVRSYPWRSLLVARAIENMACIIGVNRVGQDHSGINYNGDTMLIDAKGNVLYDAKDGKEHNITYVFNAHELEDFRKKFNVGFDWDDFKITF